MKKEVFTVFSKLFLYTSPLALFCSKNGNGGYLFLIFIASGCLCAWIGRGGLDPVIRVKPKDWWKAQFRASISKYDRKQLSSRNIQTSWDFANYITSVNRCPMPTEEEKERIVRSMGLVTEKMKQREMQNKIDEWDRLQVGKCYLLKGFVKQFIEADCDYIIEKYLNFSIKALRFYDNGIVDGYGTIYRFKQDVEEVWNTKLSISEKKEAELWLESYKSRFYKELENVQNDKSRIALMASYFNRYDWYNQELNRKHGFIK